MNAITRDRDWTASKAVRSHVPLLVGLYGASGGGKTYSALRLAKGIQSVVGGDIYGIDTEQNRMLHYADYFDFKHVPFRAPFSSSAYGEVMRWTVAQGAKTVIVDSMSHEHAGEDGYLEFHDAELNRLCRDPEDEKERDRRNMQAWIKPSAARGKMIQTMLQLDANFIFCFRAKEKVKPLGGKIEELGFMPIAGEEVVYEMTVCCLLKPVAGGVPTWTSAMPGERVMIKQARQFNELFDGYGQNGKPLNEEHGRGLALWARGKTPGTPPEAATELPGPTATAPEGFDHVAWAKGFEENLAAIESVADLDSVRGDASNKACFDVLRTQDPARAKALSAAINGRRKALAEKEAGALL